MTTDASPSTESGPELAPLPERYGAFVSYRHTDPDRRWAKWLHTGLETYRVPKQLVMAGTASRTGRVFRDEEELAASADLSQRIGDALAQARFLIVVCSRHTPASRWVNEEVQRFQASGRADRILALLIDGEPEQSFPAALRGCEPLAADVRPVAGESARSIRKSALLKLLAAILGVSFDDLRRREEARARRRLRMIAVGTSALSLTMLALSLFAWGQWQRAERELQVARAQRLVAQARLAYVAPADTATFGAASAERGVLLALESLNTLPTVEGDQALRDGMQMLVGAALEVPIDEGVELIGIGAQGLTLVFGTAKGSRVYDVATKAVTDSGLAPATAGRTASPKAGSPETDTSPDAVLARSADGRLYLRAAERTACAPGAQWVFACVDIRRTSDGRVVAILPHDWNVKFAAFSPDARWLVSVTGEASADAEDVSATVLVGHTIHVWEVASGRELSRIPLARAGGIGRTALSPDGGWLATTSRKVEGNAEGNVVRLWPLWPDLVRRAACKRLTRNLSPSEWQTFVGDLPQRPTCDALPTISS